EPICEALREAPEKGIIHGDLKPQNIMLTPFVQGKILPKFLDFGLSGLLEEASLTQSGTVGGTPAYMLPEAWVGLKKTDARSDSYALGLIAYQCLSGRLPFEAESTPSWLKKHCLEAPLDISVAMEGRFLPEDTKKAIMKALEKDKDQRYPTAPDFFLALRG